MRQMRLLVVALAVMVAFGVATACGDSGTGRGVG